VRVFVNLRDGDSARIATLKLTATDTNGTTYACPVVRQVAINSSGSYLGSFNLPESIRSFAKINLLAATNKGESDSDRAFVANPNSIKRSLAMRAQLNQLCQRFLSLR
jgi:hypothetical protein